MPLERIRHLDHRLDARLDDLLVPEREVGFREPPVNALPERPEHLLEAPCLARLKGKISPDQYKEVVLSFRRRATELAAYKIADYLAHFAKRDAIETIIYEEVF